MAYFSNGCEGDYYEERYCRRCVHDNLGTGGNGCHVLLLHLLWNYSQLDDTPEGKAQKQALDTLWPRDGVHNGECKMFVERKPDDPKD